MTINCLENAESISLKKLYPAQFNLIHPNPANREHDANEMHLKKLTKSLIEFGFDRSKPIIVDKNGMIVAGHHRFIAAIRANKEKSVPIFVMVDEKASFVDQTRRDDIAKKWSTADYIRLHSRQGKQAYIDLNKIQGNYSHFPIKIIIASAKKIANQANGNIFDDVRSGAFTFANGVTTTSVEHELDEIQVLHDIMTSENKPSGGRISMHVGLAYLWLKAQEGFNKDKFLKAVKRQKSNFAPQAGGTIPNRKQLLDIYNFGRSSGKLNVTI